MVPAETPAPPVSHADLERFLERSVANGVLTEGERNEMLARVKEAEHPAPVEHPA